MAHAFGRFTKLMRLENPGTSRSVQRESTENCVASTADADGCLDCWVADDEGSTRRRRRRAGDAALSRSIVSKIRTKLRAS